MINKRVESWWRGINWRSRSVVFDELTKFYGRYTRTLMTRDFYQMAGRAGRRGIDKEGFVYSRANLHRISVDEIRRIVYGKNEGVSSRLNTSYATILNLYEKFKEGLFKIYPLSFHYFQTGKKGQGEATRSMEAKLAILQELGHIDREAGLLTQKGQLAKAVYGYELILSELYEEGIFERLDEIGLGVLACATVFEPRKNQRFPPISKKAKDIKKTCDDLYEGIRRKESRYRISPLSKPPYFNLSHAIESWMRGDDFSRVLQFTDTDEGEIVRYFRMTIQILREINDSAVSSHILKDRIANAIRLINRDIVDAEKQLREG